MGCHGDIMVSEYIGVFHSGSRKRKLDDAKLY